MTRGRRIALTGFLLCAAGALVSELVDYPKLFDYFFKAGSVVMILGIVGDALANWHRR